LLISLGRSASDATPQRIETSWPDFVQWIHQHPRTPAKLSLAEYAHLKTFPSKSPEGRRIHDDKTGAYVVLADFGGHRRAYDTLLHSSGVPLDFDSGAVDRFTIEQTLAGYAYVAFTTYAHTAEAPRWRVFVPVARPMSADEHTATWTYLSQLFRGQADEAAKDATRLSYLPGVCLLPEAARVFHADGALFQPTPVVPAAPATLQTQAGPVPGWAGPTDDATLLTIACNTRVKVAERFGGPIHFAQLWTANEEWLESQFPPGPSEDGQAWSHTRADAALASELAYWTGGDEERVVRLMQQSGLAAIRAGDDDWAERKTRRAFLKGMEGRGPDQFHFMGKAPPDAPAPPQDAPDAPAVIGLNVGLDGTVTPPTDPLAAVKAIPVVSSLGASMNDFFAFLPDHTYIHRPSGVAISAASVDEAIGKEARQILVPTVPVHSYTWAPGYPERFTLDEMDPTHVGGESVWLYNQYRAPRAPKAGGDVSLWLNLLQRIFPDDADHILNYFADAVQFPGRKCNHALVMGSGVHGTGKDTLLVGLQYAVGERNFRAIKPHQLAETFTPWMRSVVVQVSESRDQGEGFASISRYEMYERCKDLAAAPPKALDCNEKHKGQYPVANVMRLVITTNHQVDGLHMDPNDRRHYCAWSDAEKMTEADANAIYAWYENGGLDAVAHFLRTLDLKARGFNAKAPPPRTGWWHQLVANGATAEEERFGDALDKLGKPEWVTLPQVAEAGGLELAGWIAAPANKRKLEREMVKSGYQRLPNPHEPKKGRWHLNGLRVVVYRRSDVPSQKLLRALGA
jgi:hypothetical protein